MTTIGFIGLGNMGQPMARNLVNAGHRVKGFDLVEQAVGAFVDNGGLRAASVAEAASDVEVVITMLPAGEHVRGVYLEDDGILSSAARDTLLIDCSTIDVKTAREVSEAAAICNNMVLGVSMIAISEAFALADRLGLDRQKLFDVSSESSGQCWSLTSYCPVPGPVPTSPANRDYQAGFTADMMLKDLRLAQDAAADAHADTPLGRHARDLYAEFVGHGEGATDFSGIFKMIGGPGEG
jgi:3-hydroxyisobutyrate dehydrogenase